MPYVTENLGEHTPLGGRGSVRDTQKGKLRFDLVGMEGLERLVALYTRGADKYGDNNWRKGQPVSRYWASLLRHAFMWAMGYRKEDHLAAVCWNAFGIMHVEAYPDKFADLLDHERYDLYPVEDDVPDSPNLTEKLYRDVVLQVVADYQVKVSKHGGSSEQLYAYCMKSALAPFDKSEFQATLIKLMKENVIQAIEDGYHDALWQISDVGEPEWWATDATVVPQQKKVMLDTTAFLSGTRLEVTPDDEDDDFDYLEDTCTCCTTCGLCKTHGHCSC
jgi:hypothetical protein